MKVEFEQLKSLLRKRADDLEVKKLIGTSVIVRSAHYGWVAFKDDGFDIMFKEAPWVIPKQAILNPKDLHICALHFYREGLEDHCQYSQRLPRGVAFNDSESEVISKLGQPAKSGGGNWSKTLKKSIPLWFKYAEDYATLQFQFDAARKVQIVTLESQDPCSNE